MARKGFGGVLRRATARRPKGTGPTMIQRSRSASPAEKAAYHQITGAGRRHVKREFVGLTAADEQAIGDRIEQALDKAVKEA